MKAIVIYCNNSHLYDDQIVRLAKSLQAIGIACKGITQVDDKELAKAVLNVDVTTEPKDVSDELTPEDNAIVFLGTMFKSQLKKERHVFVAAVVNSINKALCNPTADVNRQLINAMFILSQQDLNVSKRILSEYNFDNDKIAAVRDIYNITVK